MEIQKLYASIDILLENPKLKESILLDSIKKFTDKARTYVDDPSLSVVLPDAFKTIDNLLNDSDFWETQYCLYSSTMSNTLDKLTTNIGIWSEANREKQWKLANHYYQQIRDLINLFDYAEH